MRHDHGKIELHRQEQFGNVVITLNPDSPKAPIHYLRSVIKKESPLSCRTEGNFYLMLL